MGLLDSDAEELKKNASSDSDGKSGRKVNQSGLGAFKGLSKYSSLTAKYRSTGNNAPTPAPVESVEHLRGTISKSVQSHGDDGAKPVLNDNGDSLVSTDSVANKVSANQVQSVGNVGACDPVDQPILSNAELSAKSVREAAAVGLSFSPNESPKVGEIGSVTTDNKGPIGEPKSVQTPVKSTVMDNIYGNNPAEVSANQVQDVGDNRNSSQAFLDENIKSKESLQSQCIEGASLHEKTPVPNFSISHQQDVKVSANSGQSQPNVSANKLAQPKFIMPKKVSAETVQTQLKVGPKSVHDDKSSLEMELEVFHGISDFIVQNNSKCIPKHIEDQMPTESVMSLSGSQRVLVEFFFQCCVWNNSLITPPITKQRLMEETGLSAETALSSIKRLRNKFIIDRHAYKDGKSGWTQYKISETSYKELVHIQQMGGRHFQRNEFSAPRVGRVSLPAEPRASLAPELTWFKELDFSSVRPIGPMVVNASIRAMVQEKLNPEIVQDFLNRFTSWLATQGKISSPTGLFCDKLKELAREGDSPVLACMTAAEREAEAAFAQNIDRARAEMELIARSKENKASQELMAKFELEFQTWLDQVSPEDLRNLVPGNMIAPFGSEMHKALIRGHFEENIWPTLG